MLDFQQQLQTWGPQSTASPPTLAQAEQYCRELATSHYENFPVVSWLLPRELHQHFFNIYAYCRWADDLGDEAGDTQLATELLNWWSGELDACYRSETRHPVFVALRPTINQFQIPIEPFRDLISAFQQDQIVLNYDTFTQLRDYCRRSADPVGRLVLYLCRQYQPENVAWSDSICTGLQLTNFWQDVDRDADIPRCYLPREDRQQFGYSDEDLANRVTNQSFLSLMKFEVNRAREFLNAGKPLVRALPRNVRIDIDLFIHGGLRVLELIEAQGYRVWERRPKVTKWEVVKLFGRSWFRTL